MEVDLDEIEDEGTEVDDFETELSEMIVPDDEYTQEEGGDEDDSVVDEITRQVAMLGSSISEISLLYDSLLTKIFKYLPFNDLLAVSFTCLSWHQIVISSNTLWIPIYNSIENPITTYLPISSYYERVLLHGQRKQILRGKKKKKKKPKRNFIQMYSILFF